ncbi:MAG TPA: filamentous hemagglutinin N-terminal domain-containing protein [Cellvibrionaceae bacterium]
MNCAGSKRVLAGPLRKLGELLCASALLFGMCVSSVQALPQGGEVVAGQAAIQVDGAVMDVQQSSQRAIINYESFNVAAPETVNFHQPNANAVVLNRVVGSNLAEIYGNINANGQVYLINPNGVLMGQGAQLNVGGLVVTTLDIDQADFLAGRDAFAGGNQGRVENQGIIAADQQVTLLAPEVINGGEIRAANGAVTLRSASQALLQTPGSGIPILVDEADVTGQVINTGRIEAAAVALTNGGAANTQATNAQAIRNSGVVRAVRASGEGGVIELLAPGGDIVNSGSLNASASAGAGGRVNLEAVLIDQTGVIQAAAAGVNGDGGAINVHATQALALHGATQINADAAARGKGGEILVVAEKNAWFTDTASITARGGSLSGDGGFVEFSGHEFVSVNGRVDVNSVNGKAGLWYIDPTDISITNTDANGTFSGGNPHVWGFFGTPATSQINIVSIRNALSTGDVTISTASGAASVGNITFNGFLDINGLGMVRTLTLTANGTLSFQSGSIYDSNLATATDGLNINATAGTGLFIADGVGVNGTLGKVNLTTTTGDATITGVGSVANAQDAVRVTASAGRILDGGDTYDDVSAPLTNGGAILSARDGIVGIDVYVSYLDALSSSGVISLSETDSINITRLSAATSASLSAGGQILTGNSTVFGGADITLASASSIAVAQNGLTVTGNLTLQAADVISETNSRTVSLGANHLNVVTSAAGGNSIFNTATNLLSTSNVSNNTLTFNDVNALTTSSISPFTGSIIINSGAGSDLTVGSHIELDGETGTLTFNAGKDLLVNGTVTDTVGGISNNNTLNFNAANNVTFGASGAANAGAGSVSVAASNGNLALDGSAVGTTITLSAAGAGLGNITSSASMDLNGFGAVRTLNLTASGSISFTAGTIADSNTATAADGLNLNATAGSGFTVADGASINVAAGKINITTTSGNATVTGLSSAANAADAVRVTASGGSILDAGNTLTDISSTHANGGAILSGRDGITGIETNVNYIDALSSAGDISLTESNLVNVTRLSAFDASSLTAGAQILTTNSSIFGGNDLSLISSSFIQVPTAGLTMPDLVLLQGADIRGEASGRTVILGGNHVSVNTDSSGGNLQINSTTNLLTLGNTGSNNITLNDANALLIASVRPQGGSTIISSGAGTDLTVANAANELDGSNGILTLNAGADLIVNQAMLDTVGGVNNATTINLYAVNNVTFSSAGRVNAGTGSVSINATGGNVALGQVDAATVSVVAAGSITDANANVVNLVGTSATLTAGTSIATLADRLEATLASLTLTASGGSAYLSNSQALSLTSANVQGDLDVTLHTAGNFTLVQAAPTITGNASFVVSAGQIIIPDAGWSIGGNLTFSATNLVDSNTDLTLAGAAANITLSNAASNRTWATSFTSLALALTGAGDFTLTDSSGLTLTSATVGANASFTTTNGNLTLSSDPTITGNLSLITTGTGNVILPTTGISEIGNLTISANDLLDTDRTITLAAASANINLRNAASAMVWNTTFTNLVLALAGGGDFSLTDTNALTLTSASTSGNASFTTTNADLTLSADPVVTGNLSLITSGGGNLIIPVAGISQPAALTINANDLLDTDRDVTLSATNANVTLRNAASARTWASSFDSLSLALTGAGDFNLTDANALTLSAASAGGNVNLTTTNADLTLSANTTVAGTLNLTTTGTGNVVVPVAGFTQSAGLTLNANDLLDTDRNVTLGASNANITLRNAASARTWTSSFSNLILSLTGSGDFALTDSNALTLTSATTGGNASFTTINADLTLSSDPAVTGNLSLITTGTGNVIIPVAGISQPAALTINANDILDTDRDLTLAATNANITLRNAASNRTWASSFDNLSLSLTGAGDLNLTDANALTLSAASAGANVILTTTNADLTLGANTSVTGTLSLITTGTGNVVVPGAGFIQSQALTLNANDLLDTDRNVTLGATNANITLRNAASSRNWTTGFTNLILSLTGSGDFALTDSNALTLTSAATGGNASFTTTNADLTLSADPVITGNLNLNASGAGNIVIPVAGISETGTLTVNANDLLDTDRNLILAASSATITLRNAALARSWTTSFNDLILSLTGAGDFALTDSNALTLTSATTAGNASFTTTNADLTLSADPAVSGNLNLITTGTGNVIIPIAGISQPAALTINAYDLIDTDRDLALSATNASVTLRNAASARNWATSFDNLILSLTGAGDFALIDSNAFTLTSAATGGNASFASTNADLTLSTDPTVAGNLSLITTGIGNVVLPVTGISETGALTINANDLLDTDRDVTLAAGNATITLRNAALARNWTTSFINLNLSLTGSGDFALTDSNALTLSSATAGGNASFTTTNADLTLTADPAVTGNLTMITTGTGNVIIPVTGISQPAALTINANDLLDTDRDLTLAATNASITLRNAASTRNWTTSFTDLNLSLTGAGDFALTDSNALTLTSATTGGNASFTTTNADLTLSADPAVAGNLSLITSGGGNVVIPAAGIVQPAGLTINANDLLDTDRDVNLAATNASVTLRNAVNNRSWLSSFDNLILALTGAGDFALTDSNELTLTSATTGGNASFTTTNADLTLSAAPVIVGNLSLITTGVGNVIIPVAGISQSAGLIVNANDLLEIDRDITLAASSATVTLRNAATARAWATNFNDLTLTLTGAGDFSLIDNNALTLTSISTDGNASFSTTNADLTLSSNPAVAGSLSLITTGTGNVIIPVTGIAQPAALTINANDVLDVDRDITLAATNANITVRNAALARNWSTSFTNLILSLTGSGDFTLTDSNALTLTSATVGGNASFTTTNADLTLSADPAVAGNLSLITTGTGNVIIPVAGITQSAALTINANDLLDTDRDLTLAATNATITLRNAASNRTWVSSFDNLSLTLSGVGDFNLTDANALTLSAASAGGNVNLTTTNADLTLSANTAVAGSLNLTTTGTGNVVVPVAGFTQSAGLTLNANDLLDADRNVTLGATNANISLRNAASARNWTSSFSNLILSLTGSGDFALTDSNALTLTSATTDGNASFTTTNADLTLASDPAVSGNLSMITTGAGNVVIPVAGISQPATLTINANDLLDTDSTITLGATNANITLRNAASARSWTTSFNDLILSLTGAGDFALTDSNALILTSAATSGNASFTTTNADLTLSSDPAVTGNLSLIATGTGNVIIPVAGISQPAALTINANDLLDADHNIALSAGTATIALRNATTASSWATDFAHLNLSLAGGGDFALTNSNALILDSATIASNASFTTTNADLTISGDPIITGNLTLNTTGAGNVIIPVAGISETSNLTVNANDLIDTDRDITFAAAAANINLRNAALARSWATDINSLTLSLTGGGDLSLANARALTLNSITTDGAVQFTVANADLILSAAPVGTGNLSLITSGIGNVIIPVTGIAQSGDLIINANDLLDTDRNVILTAANASITLRDAQAARSWTTDFNRLDLTLNGAGDFALTNAQALTLASATSAGNASFTSAADLTLTSTPAVAGNLSLITTGAGNLILSAASLAHSAGLIINASDLIADTLAATNASITLRNATTAHNWSTDFNSLALSLTGGGSFALSNADSLTLTSVNTDGITSFTTTSADLILTAAPSVSGALSLITTGAGNVIIPTAGIAQAAALTINANDILDADRDISLAASQADITIRNAAATRNWSTSLTSLSLQLNGTGDFNLTDSDALTLISANAGGNVNLTATNADIILATNTQVNGTLNLTATGSGNVVVPLTGFTQAAGLTINANDLLDTDRTISLAASDANISLRSATSPHSWATDINNLTLALVGGGDFALTDTNALTLGPVTSTGNSAFTTTNADLILTTAPNVAGTLSLITTGVGNVIIPAAGINQPASLTINAYGLFDSDLSNTDPNLSLSATTANISLRNASAARTWDTDFNDLNLALSGAGDFNLTNQSALTINSISANGNVNIITINADTILSTDTQVNGTLNLTTTGAGKIILPNTGFTQLAGLTINAQDISDSDSTVSLGATAANITLRNASAARNWATDFNSLILSLSGGGDFALSNNKALTLGAVSANGNTSFTTTNADLTLNADPAVSGNLSLITNGSGNVIIPVAGIAQPGALTINADDIVDTDRDINLSATNAAIILRHANLTRSWVTDLDSLSLDITGTADLNITDANALTLNSLNSAGTITVATTNANLTLAANAQVNGALNLITTGVGNVVVPVAGFTQAGALTINAQDLIDTDRDVSLAATNANINLRNAAAARNWSTDFNNLALSLTGAGDFALNNSGALTLASLGTGANARFTATNGDLTLTANPTIAGNLSLITTGSGNIILPATGLTQTAGLFINANDVLDTDANVNISASSADIKLRNAIGARSWVTNIGALDLALTGAGNFALVNNTALTLGAISSDASASFSTLNSDLTLSANPSVAGNLNLTTTGTGTIVLPSTGLNHSGALTLNADDVRDTDESLILSATDANVTLRAGTGAHNWDTDFNTLSLTFTSSGDFNLTDTNALNLLSASVNGNASFTTSNGNLIIAANPLVTGTLTLATTGTGNLIIPVAGITHTGSLFINANDVLDTDSDVTLAAANANVKLRNITAARSWSTHFNSLDLALTGTGNLAINNDQALIINSASSNANLSFTTNNANITLPTNSQVTGTLSLNTGSGIIRVPDAGFAQSGALTVAADDLIDTDRNLNLSATNAIINLRNGAPARNWSTDFANLTLALNGAGAFSLTDANAITLGTINTGGNASFTTTNADLTLTSNPIIAGNSSLNTTGTGALIVPASGINHAGVLNINANDVFDTDRNVNLIARDGHITLRASAGPLALNTRMDRLDLSSLSNFALTVADADDLILGILSTGGDSTISSVGNLDLTGATVNVGGRLTLNASDQLQLAAAGLTLNGAAAPAISSGVFASPSSQTAEVTINAATISVVGGGPVRLDAHAADITLTGSDAISLDTRLDQLGLSYQAAGTFSITNGRDLNITRLDAPHVDTLTLAINGALRVPASGLSLSHSLAINAFDLFDDDRELTLSAPQLLVALSAAQGENRWNLAVDELDVSVIGSADLSLIDSNGLTLRDLNGDGSSLSLADGNLGLLLSSGDLTIQSDISAKRSVAESTAPLDVVVAQGSINTLGPVRISAQQQPAQAGNFAIRLRLTDQSSADRAISLNTGTQVTATGGDILFDTRPVATAAPAHRHYNQAAGATVAAYTNNNEANTGRVTLNGLPIVPSAEQTIGSNRWLAIVADAEAEATGIAMPFEDLSQATKALQQSQLSGPNVNDQFAKAFGDCDELDPKNRQRCKINSALKAFLSHWLVGGEMPLKREAQ